jgi:hypothetical protein
MHSSHPPPPTSLFEEISLNISPEISHHLLEEEQIVQLFQSSCPSLTKNKTNDVYEEETESWCPIPQIQIHLAANSPPPPVPGCTDLWQRILIRWQQPTMDCTYPPPRFLVVRTSGNEF